MNIVSASKYAYASCSSAPYINPSAMSAGTVRFNSPNFEVYDGFTWVAISDTATIGLTTEAEDLLDWAKKKKAEEAKLDEICKSNPALQKARDNYELIKQLVANEQPIIST